jgi:hypothetical protein
LDRIASPDPSVSAAVYYVSSLYCKAQADYAGFYRASLMYLSFVSSETLPPDFKLRLAVDISLAALLGEQVRRGAGSSGGVGGEEEGAWLRDCFQKGGEGNLG